MYVNVVRVTESNKLEPVLRDVGLIVDSILMKIKTEKKILNLHMISAEEDLD